MELKINCIGYLCQRLYEVGTKQPPSVACFNNIGWPTLNFVSVFPIFTVFSLGIYIVYMGEQNCGSKLYGDGETLPTTSTQFLATLYCTNIDWITLCVTTSEIKPQSGMAWPGTAWAEKTVARKYLWKAAIKGRHKDHGGGGGAGCRQSISWDQ